MTEEIRRAANEVRRESPLVEESGVLRCKVCGWSTRGVYDGQDGCVHAKAHFDRVAQVSAQLLAGKSAREDFPVYFAHRDARCFACGDILLDLSPTRNAPGRGNYRGQCATCKMITHYDCVEGTVEMIETRERLERERLERETDMAVRTGDGR